MPEYMCRDRGARAHRAPDHRRQVDGRARRQHDRRRAARAGGSPACSASAIPSIRSASPRSFARAPRRAQDADARSCRERAIRSARREEVARPTRSRRPSKSSGWRTATTICRPRKARVGLFDGRSPEDDGGGNRRLGHKDHVRRTPWRSGNTPRACTTSATAALPACSPMAAGGAATPA